MIRKTFLLDTNTFSYVVSGRSPQARAAFRRNLTAARLCISAVTEAELRYGIANKPEATRLNVAVEQLLGEVEVLPWDTLVARTYATFRAECKRAGISLSTIDMMIAAHASQMAATLITHDQAFLRVPGLMVERWASDLHPDAAKVL